MSAWVSVDGEIVPAAEARVSALDLGLQLGLAVFETMLVDGRRIAYFDEHLARMRDGASALEITWPEHFDAERAILELAAATEPERRAIRAMLTRGVPGRGPSLVVSARAVEPPPSAGVELVLSPRRVLAADPVVGIKSTNRVRNVLAREEAIRAGAWDALFATEEGDLTESTIANLFLVRAGGLVTPSLDRGCLPGVVRARTIALAGSAGFDVFEGRVDRADLGRADEIFLTNTTGGIVPVRSVRELTGPLAGPAGPVTQALTEHFRADERARSRSIDVPA